MGRRPCGASPKTIPSPPPRCRMGPWPFPRREAQFANALLSKWRPTASTAVSQSDLGGFATSAWVPSGCSPVGSMVASTKGDCCKMKDLFGWEPRAAGWEGNQEDTNSSSRTTGSHGGFCTKMASAFQVFLSSACEKCKADEPCRLEPEDKSTIATRGGRGAQLCLTLV